MSTPDMEHLRTVTTAVEPQFWAVERGSSGDLLIIEEGSSEKQTICKISPELDNTGDDVAEYIAALDPSTVLELIAEVDRLQKENEWLQRKKATIADLARANHCWHRNKLKELTERAEKAEREVSELRKLEAPSETITETEG